MLSRLKAAARILIKGEPKKKTRNSIPAITPEEVEEIKQFFPRDKFFILGHARSGTTLLMRLARLHPEVHCNYQAHFFTRKPMLKSLVDSAEIEEWLTRKSNRWNHGHDLSPLVLRTSADFIMERDAAREGKMIVGDKSPSSVIHGVVPEMHSLYPDAKIINIVRDGRDVLISERFRNFVEESKFLTAEDKRIIADLRVDSAPFSDGRRSIFTEPFIRNIASRWVKDLTETDTEAQSLYSGKYHTLRYEDLLQTPFDEMKRLWQFLGVKNVDAALEESVKTEMSSNPDGEWQAQRNEGIASFLPKGQAGNWQRLFTARDKALFKEIAGNVLVKWGYEDSVDW